MKDRNCPVRVFHFDCLYVLAFPLCQQLDVDANSSWMRRYDWCSFTWDPEAFPDPKKFLSEIKKEYNLKICVWINSYIGVSSAILF